MTHRGVLPFEPPQGGREMGRHRARAGGGDMRADRVRFLMIGAWLGLAALIVAGAFLLPRTQMWSGPAAGESAVEAHSKSARAEPRSEAVLPPTEPASGSTAAGLDVPASVLPRCWKRGLELAAARGSSRWSPARPRCSRIGQDVPRREPQVQHGRRRSAPLPDPMAHADEVRGAALKLFEDIRDADYDSFLRPARADEGKEAPSEATAATPSEEHDLENWSTHTFTGSPIVSIEVGAVFVDEENRPSVPYRLGLSDGSVLAGDLAFACIDVGRGPRWVPVGGIDWRLKGEQ